MRLGIGHGCGWVLGMGVAGYWAWVWLGIGHGCDGVLGMGVAGYWAWV